MLFYTFLLLEIKFLYFLVVDKLLLTYVEFGLLLVSNELLLGLALFPKSPKLYLANFLIVVLDILLYFMINGLRLSICD
jgi:hypothetical protein